MNPTIDTCEKPNDKNLGQPRALYLLVFVQMWECFSFYGMRALLVLYMIQKLEFSDARSFGVYAVYTGLVELGGIVGGMFADRVIGLRSAIFLGGWLIAAGHITMAFELGFFLGLALIILGSSLFATNISALLGLFYQDDDAKRESGFTLFYAGINIGALLASLVCGYVGMEFGWHYGFGLAALGMLVGNIALYQYSDLLEGKGKPKKMLNLKKQALVALLSLAALGVLTLAMMETTILLPILPWLSICCCGFVFYRLHKLGIARFLLAGLLLYIGAQVLFFAAEDQIGSSFMVLSERFSDRMLGGVSIPSSVLLGINPLTVVLCGALGLFLSRRKKENGNESPISLNVVISFLMGGMAFACLGYLCGQGQSLISVGPLMLMIFIISVAEVMIGPAIYAYCSKIAPEEEKGLVMGLIPIGFSLASFFGGHLSHLMAFGDGQEVQSITLYAEGFKTISILLFVSAVCLSIGIALLKLRQKNYERVTL